MGERRQVAERARVERLFAEASVRGGMGCDIAIEPRDGLPDRNSQRRRVEFVVVDNDFLSVAGLRCCGDFRILCCGRRGCPRARRESKDDSRGSECFKTHRTSKWTV